VMDAIASGTVVGQVSGDAGLARGPWPRRPTVGSEWPQAGRPPLRPRCCGPRQRIEVVGPATPMASSTDHSRRRVQVRLRFGGDPAPPDRCMQRLERRSPDRRRWFDGTRLTPIRRRALQRTTQLPGCIHRRDAGGLHRRLNSRGSGRRAAAARDRHCAQRGRESEGLARRILELSAAANDASAPAAFSHQGVLNVPSRTPPRPVVRERGWYRRLAALATKPHEYFGRASTMPIPAPRGRPEVCASGGVRDLLGWRP
jgi:hypothetical protein